MSLKKFIRILYYTAIILIIFILIFNIFFNFFNLKKKKLLINKFTFSSKKLFTLSISYPDKLEILLKSTFILKFN